jgi:hypothetical protein
MDIIDKAVSAAAGAGVEVPNIPSSDELMDSAITQVEDLLENQLAKLPDPELLIREKEAQLLEKKAELDRLLLLVQETSVEDLRETLKSLILPSLPIPLKLPLIDKRVITAMILAKKEKILEDLRTLKSRLNIERGKKAFTYPLNRPKSFNLNALPKIPKLPQIPKLPSVPELPEIPRVPTIPSADSIVKIPKLPSIK